MVRVKRIASQVRKAFEEIAVVEKWSYDLSGLCDRASVQLFLAAERHGIKGVSLVIGSGHVYNMYDSFVIDVTATQFGKKDSVYVVPFHIKEMEGAWAVSNGPFKSFVDYLYNGGWSAQYVGHDFPYVLKHDESYDPFQEYPYA